MKRDLRNSLWKKKKMIWSDFKKKRRIKVEKNEEWGKNGINKKGNKIKLTKKQKIKNKAEFWKRIIIKIRFIKIKIIIKCFKSNRFNKYICVNCITGIILNFYKKIQEKSLNYKVGSFGI